MKTAPFSVGAPRAFSARQVMTVRNGKTVAETDRCRGGRPLQNMYDFSASLLEESPKSLTGRPRAAPTNSILADGFNFKTIASNRDKNIHPFR